SYIFEGAKDLLTCPSFHLYLGFYGSTAVTIGQLFLGTNTAGIYFLGTRADYRKQGLGSAMIRRITQDAATAKHTEVSLYSTEDNAHWYTHLGFEVTCQYREWECSS
ncbi:MAG: hypothetical protein B7X06_03805, partial [Verrucomicrobia bacterium 21-51-4]